jgi:hypothetical protein
MKQNRKFIQISEFVSFHDGEDIIVFRVLMPSCLVGSYKYSNLHLQDEVPLKMQSVCSSETLVTAYKITQNHNPEDVINNFNSPPPLGGGDLKFT